MNETLRALGVVCTCASGMLFSCVSPLLGFIVLAAGGLAVQLAQCATMHNELAKIRRLLDERHCLRMQLLENHIIPEEHEHGVRAPFPWPRAPRPEGK